MTSSPRSQGGASDGAMRTCQQCGHLCDRSGEFHPYGFCAMKTAGVLDPWSEFRWQVERALGIVLPESPPLVRNLPLTASSSSEQPVQPVGRGGTTK